MQMTFRWYGEGNDSITPQDIKQIPGVTGLVWALHHKQASVDSGGDRGSPQAD